MSIRSVTVCDFCGAEKKETNHWYAVHLSAGILQVIPSTTTRLVPENHKDACGRSCVTKAVNYFLSNGTLDTDKVDAKII